MEEKEIKDVHKERCKALKKVRKKMADVLHVDLHQTECTYEGKCSGTCPKCKQEEDILNKALLGRASVAAGVVAVSAGLAGCSSPFSGGQIAGDVQYTEEQLEGEVEYVPENDLEGDTQSCDDTNSTCSTEQQEGEKSTELAPGSQEDAKTEEYYELEGDVAMPVDEE